MLMGTSGNPVAHGPQGVSASATPPTGGIGFPEVPYGIDRGIHFAPPVLTAKVAKRTGEDDQFHIAFI